MPALVRVRSKKTPRHRQRLAGAMKQFHNRRRKAEAVLTQLEREGIVLAEPVGAKPCVR